MNLLIQQVSSFVYNNGQMYFMEKKLKHKKPDLNVYNSMA